MSRHNSVVKRHSLRSFIVPTTHHAVNDVMEEHNENLTPETAITATSKIIATTTNNNVSKNLESLLEHNISQPNLIETDIEDHLKDENSDIQPEEEEEDSKTELTEDNDEEDNEENDEEDNEENDEEDGEEEDDEEDENDEEDIFEPKILPFRETRGRRIQNLIGEEVDMDAQFWGHQTWAEEMSDEEWSTEDEGNYRDIVDSDFFDTTEDEEDDNEANEIATEHLFDLEERQEKIKSGGVNRAVYQDPRKFSVKHPQSKQLIKKKSLPSLSKLPVRPLPPPAAIPRAEMGSSFDQRKIEKDSRQLIKRRGKKQILSQEDHLKMAEIYEKENTLYLNQRIDLGNWKKAVKEQKQSSTIWRGRMELLITWSSERLIDHEEKLKAERHNSHNQTTLSTTKFDSSLSDSDQLINPTDSIQLPYSREMLFFLDFDNPSTSMLPSMYSTSPSSHKPLKKVCSLHPDRIARYQDPASGEYFSDINAFKQLRKRMYSDEWNQIQTQLKPIESKLNYLFYYLKTNHLLLDRQDSLTEKEYMKLGSSSSSISLHNISDMPEMSTVNTDSTVISQIDQINPNVSNIEKEDLHKTKKKRIRHSIDSPASCKKQQIFLTVKDTHHDIVSTDMTSSVFTPDMIKNQSDQCCIKNDITSTSIESSHLLSQLPLDQHDHKRRRHSSRTTRHEKKQDVILGDYEMSSQEDSHFSKHHTDNTLPLIPSQISGTHMTFRRQPLRIRATSNQFYQQQQQQQSPGSMTYSPMTSVTGPTTTGFFPDILNIPSPYTTHSYDMMNSRPHPFVTPHSISPDGLDPFSLFPFNGPPPIYSSFPFVDSMSQYTSEMYGMMTNTNTSPFRSTAFRSDPHNKQQEQVSTISHPPYSISNHWNPNIQDQSSSINLKPGPLSQDIKEQNEFIYSSQKNKIQENVLLHQSHPHYLYPPGSQPILDASVPQQQRLCYLYPTRPGDSTMKSHTQPQLLSHHLNSDMFNKSTPHLVPQVSSVYCYPSPSNLLFPTNSTLPKDPHFYSRSSTLSSSSSSEIASNRNISIPVGQSSTHMQESSSQGSSNIILSSGQLMSSSAPDSLRPLNEQQMNLNSSNHITPILSGSVSPRGVVVRPAFPQK